MTNLTKIVVAVVAAVGLAALGGAAAIYSGVYDVGADAPHTRPVYAVLETARERSIAVRADELPVPADLADAARIRQGAGNYNAMCAGCHLTPGADETELSKGLYPKPPNLSQVEIDPATAFWSIKHGIKASGMPAWGASMDDAYIWNIAAFLQTLPKLDQAAYDRLVASSGGHSHGGGETGEGAHAEMEEGADHHDGNEAGAHASSTTDEMHLHADGSSHAHKPKTTATESSVTKSSAASTSAPPPTDSHAGMDMPQDESKGDSHDHQH